MTRTPRLLVIAAMASLVACAAPDPEPEPASSFTAADAPPSLPHAYTSPSLPTASYDPPATNVVCVAQPQTGSVTACDDSPPPRFTTLGEALAFVQRDTSTTPWTIVMHGGVYREGELNITRSNVTIQRYRSDPVSLYGSVALTGFSQMAPYTKALSSDLDYLDTPCSDLHDNPPAGSAGSTSTEGAQTAFSVTRAGVPLRRKKTTDTLNTGEFSYAGGVLTVKDPASQVELPTKLYAFKISGSNVKLAGLDIENYATCVVAWSTSIAGHNYYKGAVMFHTGSGGTLENSTVANNGASAVAIHSTSNVRLTGNVLVDNGWTGGHAADSTGLIVSDNRISFNNVRRRTTYADAGMKVTNITAGVVFGNVFEHNAATGFWCDQRCGGEAGQPWFVIARNVARHNDDSGIFYELSHHGVIASNVVHDNGASGIAAFGSRDLRIWNNTAVDNNALIGGDYHAGISVIDDARCAEGDEVPGGTKCTVPNGLWPIPPSDGAHCALSSGGPLVNTCNAEAVSLVNNLISGSRSVRPLLNVEDHSPTLYGAKRIVSREDFQAFWRSSANAPQTLIRWQTTAGSPTFAYGSLAEMKAAANPSTDTNPAPILYEDHGVEIPFPSGPIHPFFVDYPHKNFAQNPGSPDVWGNGAVLPLEVLTAVYWPATSPPQPTPRIGAIEWAQKPAVNTCPLAAPVYHRRNPVTGDHLLTASAVEANNVSIHDYPVDHGIAFNAAIAPLAGMVPVFRLLNPDSHLHFWTPSAGEKAVAAASYGYTVDEGVGFYASPTTGPCLTGVYRLQFAGIHVYSVSTAERDLLVAAGWVDEGIRFYVGSR